MKTWAAALIVAAILTLHARCAVAEPSMGISTQTAVMSTATATLEDNSLDRVQRGVSRVFVGPIGWFDRFFMPEHVEIETNRSYLRVIGGYVWENGKGFYFRRAIRVKLRLPGVTRRLSLFVTDDERDEAPAIERGAVTPIDVPTVDLNDRSRVGLRYEMLDWLDSRVDLDTALRSQARGEVSLRFRQRLRVSKMTPARFALTAFWLQGTGFGERGRLDAERPFSDTLMLRFDNAVTHIEAVTGVVGDSRLSLVKQLTRISALSLGAGVSALTRPVWRVEVYNASVLYRQAFYREWLFYEVEPGVNWVRTPEGAYPGVPTAAVRLEVQFRTGRS